MMKVIKFSNDKINFVDDRNNFVGYDLRDDCCAHGDWFISEKVHDSEPEDVKVLQTITEFPSYAFDRDFFKEAGNGSEYNAVIFRLEPDDETKPTLYLHLFNCHNGYYAKGFVSCLGGMYAATVKTGSI